jgi:hypothetical protein
MIISWGKLREVCAYQGSNLHYEPIGVAVSSVEDDPVFEPPDGFQPPRWLSKGERKHIPELGWTWTSVIERTKGRDADSWYHPCFHTQK